MAKKIPKRKSTDKKDYKTNVMKVKRKRQIVNIALTVLLVLIIISSLAILLRNNFDLPVFEKISSLFKKNTGYAVLINGEPITIDEINARYDQIPPEYKQYISKQDILDQMIDEKILMKKADELGIAVSDDEVDSYIFNITADSGTTVEEFEVLLIQNGLTLEDAKVVYKRSLALNKAVDVLVFKDLEVSNVDIEDYYYKNPELFTRFESINVSHILICHNESERCVSNLTKEEALAKAEEVKDMVEEDNFGELALEYSDEPAAQITYGNLGLITREMPFDKTFLDSAFALDKEEVSEPIETVFGYHIIKVFDVLPEEVVSLDTVYDSINQTLMSDLQSEAYLNYMGQVRNESEITYFDLEE